PDILAQLLPKLYEATQNPVFMKNTQNDIPPEDSSKSLDESPSTPNPSEGSKSTSTVSANSTSTNDQHSLSSQNSQGNSD
ncbi:hypothetical protein, partial [uncultured Methanobrevibacter sp.]|uniref:hypothetical protein n=1 Tax=uncultured Methanobrevibacter sp. TaxID=253161 RepID=UPI0025FDD092